MTNFVTDLTSLAAMKSDWETHPEIPLSQKLIATEVNDIVQACYDLRGSLLALLNPVLQLFPMIGDSNDVGVADTDQADRAFSVTTPLPAVRLDMRYSMSVTDPPVWTDLTNRDLQPWGPGGGYGMGEEIQLGRTLLDFRMRPMLCKQGIAGSTLAVEWRPSATYPSTGGNLYTQMVSRMRALEISAGGTVAGVVVNLGTNDANSAPDAAAFGANMAALCSSLRAEFGATLPIAWIKTNPNGTNPHTATVIAAQVAYAATDPFLLLIDNSDLPLVDGFHYSADGYLTLGDRAGVALASALGFSQAPVTTTPRVVGWGPISAGAGALTPRSPACSRVGDMEVLVVSTGLADVAITTPAGWTLVDGATSTFTTLKQRIAVYRRDVTQVLLDANGGRMPATTVPDTNAFNAAKIFAVRGPTTTVPTIEATANAANNAFGTSMSSTGVTTTVSNALVMMFVAGYSGGLNSVSVANAVLNGVAEQQDGTHAIGSDYQMLSLTVGTKAVAGATGAATATTGANAVLAGVTLSVRP